MVYDQNSVPALSNTLAGSQPCLDADAFAVIQSFQRFGQNPHVLNFETTNGRGTSSAAAISMIQFGG
jgi:hypothetical protein